MVVFNYTGTAHSIYYTTTDNHPDFRVEVDVDFQVDEEGDRTGSVVYTISWYMSLPLYGYSGVPLFSSESISASIRQYSPNMSNYNTNSNVNVTVSTSLSSGNTNVTKGEETLLKQFTLYYPAPSDEIVYIQPNGSMTLRWAVASGQAYTYTMTPDTTAAVAFSPAAKTLSLTTSATEVKQSCDETPVRQMQYMHRTNLPTTSNDFTVYLNKNRTTGASFKNPSTSVSTTPYSGFTQYIASTSGLEPGTTYTYQFSTRYPYGSSVYPQNYTQVISIPQYAVLVKQNGVWKKAIPCVRTSGGWNKVHPLARYADKWQMGLDYTKTIE